MSHDLEARRYALEVAAAAGEHPAVTVERAQHYLDFLFPQQTGLSSLGEMLRGNDQAYAPDREAA